jgi:hypothetical protein
MQALHLVPAGLTGYDGWVLNQQEMSLCAPLASEVFQELFPADSYWVKLIAFAGVMGGIEIRKFHAYKAWLAQRAPKPTPRAGDAAPKSSPLPSNSGEAAPLPKSDGLKPNIPPLPV